MVEKWAAPIGVLVGVIWAYYRFRITREIQRAVAITERQASARTRQSEEGRGDGFRDCCREHFHFLIRDYGCLEEPIPPRGNQYQCRFVNSTTRVIIEGVHYGSGVDIAIGPFAPMRRWKEIEGTAAEKLKNYLAGVEARKNYVPQYYLDDILALRCPELRLIRGRDHPNERNLQALQIPQYAAAVQEHCQDLLKGDFSTIAGNPSIRSLSYLG